MGLIPPPPRNDIDTYHQIQTAEEMPQDPSVPRDPLVELTSDCCSADPLRHKNS